MMEMRVERRGGGDAPEVVGGMVMRKIAWVGIAVPLVVAVGAATALGIRTNRVATSDSNNVAKVDTSVQSNGNNNGTVNTTFNTFVDPSKPPTVVASDAGAREAPAETTKTDSAPIEKTDVVALSAVLPSAGTPPPAAPEAAAAAPPQTPSYVEKCSGLKGWLRFDKVTTKLLKPSAYRISLTISNTSGTPLSLIVIVRPEITITDDKGNELRASTDFPSTSGWGPVSTYAENYHESGMMIPTDEPRTIDFTSVEIPEVGQFISLDARVAVSMKKGGSKATTVLTSIRCEDLPLRL